MLAERDGNAYRARHGCGCSSVVERQLPKLNVVGSIPIARSNIFNGLEKFSVIWRQFCLSQFHFPVEQL